MTKTSNVERIYEAVKTMATRFELRPDEKLNEARLASQLKASRTPLREALNKLVSEGFLTFQKGRGFFCRPLTAEKIYDLYELRAAIECKIAEVAAKKTTPDAIAKLTKSLNNNKALYNPQTRPEILVALDESFHMALARIADNSELSATLENINARIRFIRTLDIEERYQSTPQNHRELLDAIAAGDSKMAAKKMLAYITRSRQQATETVRKAYGRIYVDS